MNRGGGRRCQRALLLGIAAVLAACGADDSYVSVPSNLVRVAHLTPFTLRCDGQLPFGSNYASSEVEPSVSVNPLNPDHRIGTWQQDRWSNGGARGALAAVSFDGGAHWSQRQVPFSVCTGGNSVNGGDYARATDPWISFAPNGSVYWMVMTITETASQSISAMRVSRSLDGGNTWDAPITLIHDTQRYFNDKNAVTADPTDGQYAFAVWDRLDLTNDTGPAWFSRTTDGGASWEPARLIYDPGSEAQTIGNQIAVLADGTLLNLFTEVHYGSPTEPESAWLAVLRSTDKGQSWSAPAKIADLFAVGTRDPDTLQDVRTGAILGSIAIGSGDQVWVAWQDSRYAPAAPFDSIVLARSVDGGLSWGAPLLVSGGLAQAFTPAIQVAADGTIGITYYDFRENTSSVATLLTDFWLATSADGTSWTEQRLAGPFNLAPAPNALGLFLGDYTGLASAGSNFVPLFALSAGGFANRTDLYSTTVPTVASAAAKVARYRAVTAMPAAMTPEWAAQIGRNIELNRQHFPDRVRPGQLPPYLRSLG